MRFNADLWMTKILSYPGIDENTLAQKKIYWLASTAVTLMILLLTITYHILFPQLRIIIYYGFFLSAIFLQGVIFPPFVKFVGLWWMFTNQFLVALATLYCILKLGGIPYSGGLVFVGLALVFFSLNFNKKSASISIFIVYVITVIIAGIMNPRLKVPPEMTTEVNISLFVINLLWISGFALIFVMSFIKQRVRLEQLETIRVRELDDAKARLYTNITHEFRTPLTIISGMTDLIKEDPEKWLAEGCSKIDRNAKILLNLVNQMLDLSKLENGAMPVRMIRADINRYIKYIVELFQSIADVKFISLKYYPVLGELIIDHDPEKIMHILTNLISNAIKFTQRHGSVIISSEINADGKFEIRVSDNGPGIPEEHLEYIFDRFYRVEDVRYQPNPGSGLGLALTRELVKLLKGTVTVKSIYGEGTEFTISLPVTRDAPLQEVPEISKIQAGISGHIINDPVYNELNIHPGAGNNNPLLLIVEDNYDVVSFVTTILEKEYDLMVASDGREGLRKAIEFVPDIILSDIMMPGIDGLEMLEKIKKDVRTSHIPVVILTAKADIESRVTGIETGADAYLAKPFIKEELLVQLRSLIEQRKILQERYSSVNSPVLNAEKGYHMEDAFINRIREILTENLGDENFGINNLCSYMAMSRTQLYRKFRSLTNKTIAEYFRTLRLHKARELLHGSDTSVSEAAYRTGFKNLSHFSRIFTREFGINPSEIRK